MIVYRITKRKYSNDLTGIGAAMYGGRWNKKGSPVLYTGASKEIVLLETIVNTPSLLVPELDMHTIEIPSDSITEIKTNQLPENWSDYPAPTILSEIAEEWVEEGKTIALKVPSCIIESASIYILNCHHIHFSRIKFIKRENFHFDPRLKR